MLHKTRGVVFRFTKFRETSIIVTIFTELFGLQSYIVNSVRSAKGKMALFQPLTLLDMVVYHRENANINRIKELKCLHPYETLHRDIRKAAIALFLNEVLNKCIKEESHSAEMYRFIQDSLIGLDNMQEKLENFHLIFLIRLSRQLGFGISSPDDIASEFPGDEESLQLMKELLEGVWTVSMPVHQRRKLLNGLLQFYRRHLENMGEIKSVDVLREVLG
ncbi:MAG: DNA repair protein RecO [Cyclobacteriaceae bacterium]|nr:DNA repair protein RecO [Cyclobacteriaceae bacterium]MDW8330979.1 DNA repair protein RecO [Cyclobacteriaceae bacterium]